MANSKAQATANTSRKRASARRACQKKQKAATRFRNDQLREDLDRQAHAIHVVGIMIRHVD